MILGPEFGQQTVHRRIDDGDMGLVRPGLFVEIGEMAEADGFQQHGLSHLAETGDQQMDMTGIIFFEQRPFPAGSALLLFFLGTIAPDGAGAVFIIVERTEINDGPALLILVVGGRERQAFHRGISRRPVQPDVDGERSLHGLALVADQAGTFQIGGIAAGLFLFTQDIHFPGLVEHQVVQMLPRVHIARIDEDLLLLLRGQFRADVPGNRLDRLGRQDDDRGHALLIEASLQQRLDEPAVADDDDMSPRDSFVVNLALAGILFSLLEDIGEGRDQHARHHERTDHGNEQEQPVEPRSVFRIIVVTEEAVEHGPHLVPEAEFAVDGRIRGDCEGDKAGDQHVDDNASQQAQLTSQTTGNHTVETACFPEPKLANHDSDQGKSNQDQYGDQLFVHNEWFV